ncbi:MAG: glycosyltransferase involved in cell wall biosynthesis [Vicingaceae bacterium]
MEANNFKITFSNIINEEDDYFLYKKGQYVKKALIAKKARRIRKLDVHRMNEFDIIFIHREALLTGSTYFEREFAKSSAKVVFDFDDAIWLPNVSSGNKALQMLKNPSKTEEIISCADMVFAGNDYLAGYASKFCSNVKVIPTTIDTNYHKRKKQNTSDRICIGWTGTETTRKYLEMVKPVLQKLTSTYGDKIYFKVICDQPWSADGIELKNEKWNKNTEIEQLEEIDIGIMPLTDDQWSRGKCGFKGLQYMAMESATIMSPVGVNTEIVIHGKNGFLASSENEWYEQLSTLIDNKELRLQIGRAGRVQIEEKFSVNVTRGLYLKYLKEIIN